MLRDKKFLIAVSVSVLLIILIGVFRPREIDWSPSFSASDKIPYGAYVFYNSLPDIFGKQAVKTNTRSVYSLLHNKTFENTTLFFVQKSFTPAFRERKELLAFAARGNTVFISASHLGMAMADTLKIVEKQPVVEQVINKAIESDTASYSQANFTNPQLRCDSAYFFKRQYPTVYYDLTDTASFAGNNPLEKDIISDITVLGVDELNRPAFIRISYGTGYIFIHNNPYAFSNYYMLKPRGAEYAARCLANVPAGQLIWDEYYKNGSGNYKTSLSFILSKESFRWAYYTAMAFLLIFILFNVKRRQRAIPVVDPFKNASLEFTKTIGSLYFNQSNHKNIALKKITYLLEYIRNRYNIDTVNLDEDFARKLCYKSGMSQSAVEHLLSIISGIERKERISSTELIDLNHTFNYFKNNCQ